MNPNRKIHILSGGTFTNVAPHLALGVPAFGAIGGLLFEAFSQRFGNTIDIMHHKSKMVKSSVPGFGEQFHNNLGLANLCHRIAQDPLTKIVVMAAAVCDFELQVAGHPPNTRLDSGREYQALLKPAPKILPCFRQHAREDGTTVRKDIFLIGFKTTCGMSNSEMMEIGLKSLRQNSCNMVVVNDITRHMNMIITPEEAVYPNRNGRVGTTDRLELVREIVDIAFHRSQLTFTRSTVIESDLVSWDNPRIPETLRGVIEHCIEKDAYKAIGNQTVGHFAVRLSDTEFLTSIRKTNFNQIATNGMVYVRTDGPDTVLAYGAKPSVGGQSQRQVFRDHPGYDCILHFHCPMTPAAISEGRLQVISQREVECGSHQCGANTSSGLRQFLLSSGQTVKAVHLENHGPNIVFPRDVDLTSLIEFVEHHWDLSKKTGGFIPPQKFGCERCPATFTLEEAIPSVTPISDKLTVSIPEAQFYYKPVHEGELPKRHMWHCPSCGLTHIKGFPAPRELLPANA